MTPLNVYVFFGVSLHDEYCGEQGDATSEFAAVPAWGVLNKKNGILY
jgi:hypothetical protein